MQYLRLSVTKAHWHEDGRWNFEAFESASENLVLTNAPSGRPRFSFGLHEDVSLVGDRRAKETIDADRVGLIQFGELDAAPFFFGWLLISSETLKRIVDSFVFKQGRVRIVLTLDLPESFTNDCEWDVAAHPLVKVEKVEVTVTYPRARYGK